MKTDTELEADVKPSCCGTRASMQMGEGTVTLTGLVRSWCEREDAERAAWAAPDKEVKNELAVTA